MTSFPPLPPAPILQYQTPVPRHRARTLVLLAGIFNSVLAGLNLLGALGYGVMTVSMWIVLDTFRHVPPIAATYPGAPPPTLPTPMPTEPIGFMLGIFGGGAVLSLAVAVVQLIAGIKLLRRRRSAWAWGIAAGIISCCELWFSLLCVIPLAAGVYTLVACFLTGTREYLAAEERTRQSQAAPR